MQREENTQDLHASSDLSTGTSSASSAAVEDSAGIGAIDEAKERRRRKLDALAAGICIFFLSYIMLLAFSAVFSLSIPFIPLLAANVVFIPQRLRLMVDVFFLLFPPLAFLWSLIWSFFRHGKPFEFPIMKRFMLLLRMACFVLVPLVVLGKISAFFL